MNIGTTFGFITLNKRNLASVRNSLFNLFFEMIHQDGGNIFTGSLRTYGADIVCNHRHSVYDTRVLILPDGECSALTHLEKTVRTVASHTGHNDTDLVDRDIFRNRIEQHINRRTMAAYLGARTALYHIIASGTDNFHLFGAGSDQGQPGLNDVSVLGLAYFHAADSVQTLSIHGCKSFRHMLGDDHSRDVAGEPL